MADISSLPGSCKPDPKNRDTEKSVIFQPIGRRAAANPEKTILDLALEAGVGIESACGGKGRCGKCRVRPEGAANEPSIQEKEHLRRGNDKDRLACQTRLLQGGTVWLPEPAPLHKPVILTTGPPMALQMDPLVRSHELKLSLPSVADPKTLQDLLLERLGTDGERYELPLSILQDLPKRFKDRGGRVTVVTRQGNQILDIAPGHEIPILGLAVDLGTTTIVAYLFDLKNGLPLSVEAQMNPQISYGDDVISRIGYGMGNPQKLSLLSAQIRACIDRLAAKACETVNLSPQRIMDCVMVGNTAMHHLFLGLDPVFLSQAPYMPVTQQAIDITARDVGLAFADEARLYWLPVKAGFVGADTVAVAIAVHADEVIHPTLILDLGTNGEMILAVPGCMMCCSTAAGPAFEGGHILYGMRAGPGAIETVTVDSESLACEFSVIGRGKPTGLCGSGLVSLISQLTALGVITSGGSFNPRMMGSHLRSGLDGLEYVVAFADQCGFDHDLVLTGQDVSEVQLAKGAIRAGVEIMMQELGITQLGEVLLAGAFANTLNPQDAQQLGLFPRPDQNRILNVGNAAGNGAVMALISSKERKHADLLSVNMHYLELTTHPDFQALFVDWMAFNSPDSPE